MRYPRIMVILSALSVLAATAFPQAGRSQLAGTVKDSSGGTIPGSAVEIINERTGATLTALANDQGYYVFPSLQPATYTVRASAGAFAPAESKNVSLLAGEALTLNLTLRPAGTAESVTVEASQEQPVDTSSARLGANVNEREVHSLPLNGRQLSQLYLQAPGSVNTGSGTFWDIRFNGRSNEQNVIRYDGVEGTAVLDASPGSLNGEIPSPFRLQSSLENVQEFRVDSSSFPAELGGGTGGQVGVVTRSGSNKFHGSVFEYLRNDAVDAANFFDNLLGGKAPLRLNQFGASLGGPIAQERAFFFFSYEGYRLRAGINSIEAVPGAQARICAPAPNGVPCVEADGQTSRTLALLPAFRDPRAVIISPGSGANLFDVAQLRDSARVDEDAYALRLDFRLNQKHSLYARYFRDTGVNNQPEGVSGRHIDFTAVPQNSVLALQSFLGTSLLNELKVGYNGVFTRTNGLAPVVNGIDLSRLAINISGNTANYAISGQGTSAGTSNPGGLIRANSATNGRGQPYTVYSVSVIDNLSWTRGNHRIYTDRLGGTTYVFNNLTDLLGNRAASVQYLGDVSEPSVWSGGATGNRLGESEYYFGYAQDQWKFRRNLTFNYGLRFEYYTPLREANDRQVFFDTINGAIKPSGSDNNPLNGNRTNFAPRLSLAWSPRPDNTGFFGGGHTALRLGFGIYYGVGQVEDQIQPIESDRIASTVNNS
ncbi:MAG: hypothetical protein DMG07_16530, partial [Acidobacteria bacterium]